MSIKQYLGSTHRNEEQLMEAYKVVSDRHSREFEDREMLLQFAEWSKGHMEAMQPVIDRYGKEPNTDAEQLRSSLFHGARIGGAGLMRDLADLSLLATSARTQWTILDQMAGTVKDKELENLAKSFGEQIDRELDWLCTRLKTAAPQAGVITPDLPEEAAASVPKKVTSAGIPDQVWAPLAAGALALVVGLASLLLGRAFLFPSLGPTAYLAAENPAHPSTRLYNTIVGHIIGLAAGFLGVMLFGVLNDPAPLQTGQLTAGRMGASVVALALTLLVALLLKASHPPAGATTLLVSLGAIKDLNQVISLVVGVLIVALLGEVLRRIRLGSLGSVPLEGKVPTNAGR